MADTDEFAGTVVISTARGSFAAVALEQGPSSLVTLPVTPLR